MLEYLGGYLQQGDFTALAKAYINRPGYSELVLKFILKNFEKKPSELSVADVGAGTGKLTENLLNLGLKVNAVEPNDAMREEGIANTKGHSVSWRKGSGEETGLDSSSMDWLLMASSFHWVKTETGLKEFHRVLRPGGLFTALWNPRHLERSELQKTLDLKIREIVPDLKRVSSGSKEFTSNMPEKLVSTGHFTDVIFMEAQHEVSMSQERYMGAWKSVNDIQAQAGSDRWNKILKMIQSEISSMKEIIVPYVTRSWTCRRKV